MEENNKPVDVNLEIAFPKSKEDHRLQLVAINQSIFAIVHSSLESLGPISLDCQDWSLILLAPIKSKVDIKISAINIICLSEIVSGGGSVKLEASNRLVKFTDLFQGLEDLSEIAKQGQFEFGDDPAALLYYYRLFEGIIQSVKTDTPTFFEAQQKFITALCSLAQKIEKDSTELDLQRVLSFWGISPLDQKK